VCMSRFGLLGTSARPVVRQSSITIVTPYIGLPPSLSVWFHLYARPRHYSTASSVIGPQFELPQPRWVHVQGMTQRAVDYRQRQEGCRLGECYSCAGAISDNYISQNQRLQSRPSA